MNTAEILPESRPVLKAVRDILAADPRIQLVLIEGHASEEGEHQFNYDLSVRRARAIQDALVEAGVAPERLAIRGMGEVAPVVTPTGPDDQVALAANRRVVFRIIVRSSKKAPR